MASKEIGLRVLTSVDNAMNFDMMLNDLYSFWFLFSDFGSQRELNMKTHN